jgi:hypothetical protein
VNRIAFLLVVFGLLTAACGDEGLLDGLGDRTRDAVVGTTTTTEEPVDPSGSGPGSGLELATAVTWYNDGIDGEVIGLPAYTIGEVWERGHDSGRFVQSSRAEIATALPGIRFPGQIPGEVDWVTSQLVFLEDVATLDAGTSAAFGLWEVEPYSTEQGRVGVLRVGNDRADIGPDEIAVEVVTAGLSLIWADGTYRYELFCRASVPEAICRRMVESAVPLRTLLATST